MSCNNFVSVSVTYKHRRWKRSRSLWVSEIELLLSDSTAPNPLLDSDANESPGCAVNESFSDSIGNTPMLDSIAHDTNPDLSISDNDIVFFIIVSQGVK